MKAVSRVDLGRLALDEGSLLAQALALGVRWGKLPGHAPDAARAYFQMYASHYGRRFREGIAVGEDVVRRGVKQAAVCVELGLRERCADDTSAAVDVLAEGDFEGLRRRGWELAFERLEAIRDGATRFLAAPETAFLQEYVSDARIWAALTPETWEAPDEEAESGKRGLDPLNDYARWREVEARWALLRSLPKGAFFAFRKAAGGRGGFGDVARNLVLALALGIDRLAPRSEEVAAFVEMLAAGRLSPEVEARVLGQIGERLTAHGVDEDLRALASRAVIQEMAVLEAARDSPEGFFVLERKR